VDIKYLLVAEAYSSALFDFWLERTQSLAKRKWCGRALRSIGRPSQPVEILWNTGKPFREPV